MDGAWAAGVFKPNDSDLFPLEKKSHLGAQLFALGLHPVLCAIQSAIGDRGVVVAYADDIHILAPPSVVAARCGPPRFLFSRPSDMPPRLV